jgi:uncharacterized protein (DUF1330 family)
MPAYIIAQVKINDPVRYEDYRRMVPASLATYGGKFIVRGGRTEPLEGGWNPPRLVVLEFPNAAAARRWWESDEYAEAKALREAISETQMLIVEGFS